MGDGSEDKQVARSFVREKGEGMIRSTLLRVNDLSSHT